MTQLFAGDHLGCNSQPKWSLDAEKVGDELGHFPDLAFGEVFVLDGKHSRPILV